MFLHTRALRILAVIATTQFAPALSNAAEYNDQVRAASQTVLEGHVKDGLQRLATTFQQLDPTNDTVAYWNTGSTLIDLGPVDICRIHSGPPV